VAPIKSKNSHPEKVKIKGSKDACETEETFGNIKFFKKEMIVTYGLKA
jgi:hypothetical protein